MDNIRNTDDLIKAIEADELADKLEAAAQGLISMSVQEYARAHNIQPQRIYYYIRRGRIKLHACGECGRKVIDIADADVIFKSPDPVVLDSEEPGGDG